MRIFLNELRKILQLRALLLAFLAVLLLNGILAYWQAEKSAETKLFTWDEGEYFYTYYINNSEEIDDYYSELIAYQSAQKTVKREIEKADGVFTETRQAIYTDGLYTGDIVLIESLYVNLDLVNSFRDETDVFLRNTKINYNEYIYQGYAEDSFMCKYQLRAQTLYTNVRDNVRLKFEYVRGWEDYYSFEITGVLLLCMVALVVSVVFTREKDVGILPLIRVSRNGRIQTVAAKLLAVFCIVTICSFILTLENFAVFGLTEGYSTATNAIQILPELRRSWLILSLGQYFWVHLALRTLGVLAFALPLVLLSVVFYNYVLTYASSLAFFGLNFWMYSSVIFNKSSIIRYINVVSLTGGVRPAERYFGVNLFSAVCGYLPLITGFVVLCGTLAAVGTSFLYCHGFTGFEPKWLMAMFVKIRTLVSGHMKAARKPKLHSFPRSLLLAEGYKLLFASRFWIIVLALVLIKGYSFYRSPFVTEAHGYTDTMYESYVTRVEGEWSLEKEALLERLRVEQALLITIHDEMVQNNRDNLITTTEYLDYMKKFNHAPASIGALDGLLTHSAYLQNEAKKTGFDGWFLYETGWDILFNLEPDYFLYAAVLILVTGVFSQEYGRNCFAKILRCTKYGRRPTFLSKLGTVSLLTVALSIIFQSISFTMVAITYRLPCHGAPLNSLEAYTSVTSNITIGQYLLFLIVLRLIAAEMLTLLIFCFSELIRRNIPVMALTAALTILPAVMVNFGLGFAEKLNYLSLLQGKPLFLASANAGWFGSNFGLLLINLLLIFTFLYMLITVSEQHFTK